MKSVKVLFISLSGVFLISTVSQTYSSSYAATTAQSTNSSTSVSAVVAASIHTCSWYLENVPESIILSNPDNLEYVGQDLPLESVDLPDMTVFFSGNTEKGDRCSFYDEVTGVELAMSVTGTGFFNSGPDDSLDWSFGDLMKDGSLSQFSVSLSERLGSCSSDFTTSFSPRALINSLGDPIDFKPVVIGPTVVNSNFHPFNLPVNNPDFADCTLSTLFQSAVPGGGTPSRPGQSYSFVGPTVSTTLTVLDSDPA